MADAGDGGLCLELGLRAAEGREGVFVVDSEAFFGLEEKRVDKEGMGKI